MMAWLIIGAIYLLILLELLVGDTFILTRYLHFAYLPYFLLVTATLIAFILFARSKVKWFLPAFTFIAYTFVSPLTGSLLPTERVSENKELRFMSYSVNARNQEYKKVAKLLKNNPSDLICLQEIPYDHYKDFLDVLESEGVHYQHIYSKLSASMLLAKQTIIPLTTVPFQKATVTINGKEIRVWNLHSPKSLSQTHYQSMFFKRLNENIEADKSPYKIICGDFNATPHNEYLHSFFTTFQPAFHQSESFFNFTYPTNETKIPTTFPFLKIDYLFFSQNFIIKNYKRLSDNAHSDHYPITANAIIQD